MSYVIAIACILTSTVRPLASRILQLLHLGEFVEVQLHLVARSLRVVPRSALLGSFSSVETSMTGIGGLFLVTAREKRSHSKSTCKGFAPCLGLDPGAKNGLSVQEYDG